MQVNASLYVHERQQPRDVVDCPGTLRDQNDLPVDIVIEDISLTGFKCRCEQQVRLDSHVRIGLPGVGMRFARSVRQRGAEFGFEFTNPISMAQLSAIGSSTIVHGRFSADAASQILPEDFAPVRQLPIGVRAILIVAASGALWAALGVGVRQLLI